MDKFIVRFSVLSTNIYIPIVLIFAINGIDISDYDYLLSGSFIFGILVTVLVHSQGKYHCKWIRGLCYNSVTLPIFNFADSRYNFFDDVYMYILAVSLVWSIFVLYTIILAIRHFTKVRKLKREQYEIRRRNESED